MQVTPELIAWLDSQRQAGFGDEALLKALVNAGYTEAFSLGLLSEKKGAAVQPDAVRQSAQPVQTSSTLPVTSLAWFGQQSTYPVLDVDVQVLVQMKHPQLAVFEGLLTDAECDALIEQARSRLSSSLTVDSDSGDSVAHQARVSSGMFFQRGETELVGLLERRMSTLLGFPENHGEGLQILNYKPGGKYDPHQDYFDPAQSGSHVHLKRGGQRIGTLICYLNTPQSGGGTVFPDVGLTVSAVRGRAVYFAYPVAHVSSACLHGGNPVIEGEKWIATKWIRESVFQ